MKSILLPYKKSIHYILSYFFGIPFCVYLYLYFWEGDQTVFRGVQGYGFATILCLLLLLPIFTFKPNIKVAPEKAIAKMPISAFIFWWVILFALLFIFAGIGTYLAGDSPPLNGILIFGLGLSTPCLFILNSNRILFRWEYQTEKQGKQWAYKKTTNGYFKYKEDGFSFKKKKIVFVTTWAAIEQIIAYKTDHYTYDTIHIIIQKNDGTLFRLSEDMAGWFVFKKKLTEHLSGVDELWELKVMSPAFELRKTLVYKAGENLCHQE